MASHPKLTLAEYLLRMPRGLRYALLWSPAAATAYFMYGQHSVYYSASANRRLLCRPEDEKMCGAVCFPVAGSGALEVVPFTRGAVGDNGPAANVWRKPLRVVRDCDGRVTGYAVQ